MMNRQVKGSDGKGQASKQGGKRRSGKISSEMDEDVLKGKRAQAVSSDEDETLDEESGIVEEQDLRGEFLFEQHEEVLENYFAQKSGGETTIPVDAGWADEFGGYSLSVAPPAPGIFTPRQVFGRDDRLPVSRADVDDVPYRKICHLEIVAPNGVSLVGTGWLIGPRTVITAGHCVWPRQYGNNWARSIKVFPGRHGTYIPHRAEYIRGTGSGRLHSFSEWTRQGVQAYDIGAIELDEPLGDIVGYFGFAHYPAAELRTMKLNIPGYPAEKRPYATPWVHGDVPRQITERQIQYTIDTTPGNSGSPVIFSDQGHHTVVGIHNYGGNLASRINQEIFDQLSEWKK